MRLILGLLLGAMTACAGLYASATYYFSDYFVSEHITATAELQNTVVALEKLQTNLEKHPELSQVNVCPLLCKPSQYQMLYGGKANKVSSLTAYLQNFSKTAANDPGFLLDLLYVQGSMTPVEDSGFFTWLKEVPQDPNLDWQARASLSSRLAITGPRLVLALRDARSNSRKVDLLWGLRESCKKSSEREMVESQCVRVLVQ
ncbi:hypothetical protein D3C87_175590 [compost metagenome]